VNAIAFIKTALEGGRMWLETLLKDVDDRIAMTMPTPNGGNHPRWIVGHIAVSEASVVAHLVKGEAAPLAEWQPLFGRGSTPSADASQYPPMDELLRTYHQVREQTLALLDTLSEADLDRETSRGADNPAFGTVGRCLATMISHQAFHAGQVADARRAAGRAPAIG
jgi:uncharacterized damage-inducible protein DinB